MPLTPEAFANLCLQKQVTISHIVLGHGLLTVTKEFEPGSNEGFTGAEIACSIIYDTPGKGGSVWGTDGGSVGGLAAMHSGVMKLNKSGVPKRWLQALSKLSWARSAETE